MQLYLAAMLPMNLSSIQCELLLLLQVSYCFYLLDGAQWLKCHSNVAILFLLILFSINASFGI